MVRLAAGSGRVAPAAGMRPGRVGRKGPAVMSAERVNRRIDAFLDPG